MRLPNVLKNRLVFYGEVARSTKQVGAFTPTSRRVAEAIAAPIPTLAPRRVLEVGPGTGALTRSVIARLGAGDTLDLCEINPAFASYLRSEFSALEAPRVRVFEADVAALPPGDRYDVIVSSLPFMNFEPEAVRRILDLYSERLTEGGVITSWDYWFREIRTYIQSASERRRMRAVLRVTREFLARHEWSRRVVLWNVPPACVYQVRHRRHEGPSLAGGPLAGPHGPTG